MYLSEDRKNKTEYFEAHNDMPCISTHLFYKFLEHHFHVFHRIYFKHFMFFEMRVQLNFQYNYGLP